MTTRLDIVSDPICPWCFIGKLRLERALEARPDHPFDIHWRPFQLNPDMPSEGMDRATYLAAKFGGEAAAAKAYAAVVEAAETTGVALKLAAIQRTPNTLDAHRLLRWARIEGHQTPVANLLFQKYFLHGNDISNLEILVEIAASTGIDPDLVRRLLTSDADRDAIQAEDQNFREMGVTSVPTFIIGGHYVLVGAQETEIWLRAIDDITATTAETGG